MSLQIECGIVGLPNIGKSTLFNALLKKQQALVANYPFVTIEQNVGIVAVPDERLQRLAEITAQEIASPSVRNDDSGQARMTLPPIKPATVEFLDIAGLVKGASAGAGLGNKFLSHIREASVIAHVVRAFADENIIREGSVDPLSDYQTIQTELMLADLETISKIKNQKSKSQSKIQKEVTDKLFEALNGGIPARNVQLTAEEKEEVEQFCLLSAKPEIVVLNVSEEDYTQEKIPQIMQKYSQIFSHSGKPQAHPESDSGQARMTGSMVVICAKIEAELAALSEEEQKEYLKDLGLVESGLERLIKKAYETLGLISFLTAGEKEVRAWTISRGTDAQNAAGVIHTDFIKKFIKAEVVSFDDFTGHGGWKGSREAGKARLEGRDYIMHDGDVVEFKIGT